MSLSPSQLGYVRAHLRAALDSLGHAAHHSDAPHLTPRQARMLHEIEAAFNLADDALAVAEESVYAP